MRLGPALLFALLWTGAEQSKTQSHTQPLLEGLDHIPVVVRDLEQTQSNFKALGFAKLSARPRHYAQNELEGDIFKKTSPLLWQRSEKNARPARISKSGGLTKPG